MFIHLTKVRPMKLYYHPLSTYSQKVLIACYEKGIAFEPHVINVSNPKERAAFRGIYPLGKIPLLVTEDQRLIPESSIIIEYFDQAFPNSPDLIPKDPEQARQVRFRDRMHDLYLNDPIVALLFESRKPEAEQDFPLIHKSRHTLDVIYEFLNNQINNHSWSNGEQFSMADCAAAPALFYAQRIYPFAKYPNIKAYFSRLMGHPAYRKVIKEAEPLVKKFLG
ncbi:glutathione S-transferase [Paremcibacter congregatus]|uniref:Glutathione S-transferase n=2 Tax=Paremcibacter congregatus TaxID=2043170 RepID=A0A2G4YM95_9PROT|nr:glutathione S-transferase [Paremcibacter congregatus]QDE28097.1 glutathione S-transferase family protein [Paremcibacter congregatus]